MSCQDSNHHFVAQTVEEAKSSYGLCEQGWDWLTEQVQSITPVAQRRLLFFLDKKGTILCLPKVGMNGGSSSNDPTNPDADVMIAEDLRVFHLLKEMTRYFPGALRYVSFGLFHIPYEPLRWELASRIRQQLTECRAKVDPVDKSKDKTHQWPLDKIGDSRPLMPHQTDILNNLIARENSGMRAHFLMDRCGTGKTRSASEYLLWYLKHMNVHAPHNMPKYVFYVAPPATIGPENVPAELAQSKWPLHTWVPLQDKKRSTKPKPYHINLIKHDHVRLCVDEMLQYLSDGDGVLFIDEAHECLGKSQRAACVKRASHTAARLACISGTPVIHTDLMEAVPFVSQMVAYTVNRNNIWTASQSMTAFAPPPDWKEKDVTVTATLTESEKLEYRKSMPIALGGILTKAESKDILRGSAIVKQACTRKMIESVEPGTVVWAIDTAHQRQIVDGLRTRWKDTKNEVVLEISPEFSVNLTGDNEDSVHPQCKAIVVPKRLNSSANYQRFDKQMEMEMQGNYAKKVQRRGRIGRDKGQKAKVLTFITVVDDTGLLDRMRQKHDIPAQDMAILRSAFGI
jgi:hypothetical protein